MANANRYTGSNLRVMWNDFANAISGDYTSFTVNRTVDSAEKTAGSETVRTFIPTLETATFDLTTRADGTSYEGTVLYNRLEGTLIFAPEGTADGKPAYRIPAFVAQKNTPFTFDGITEFQFQFQANGAWIDDYDSDVTDVWNTGTIA